MRLYLLIFLSVLSGMCLMLLIIALTDTFSVQQLKDYGFVIGIIFISIGGFTRQAYTKYKQEQNV
jgi:hypothetical protein